MHALVQHGQVALVECCSMSSGIGFRSAKGGTEAGSAVSCVWLRNFSMALKYSAWGDIVKQGGRAFVTGLSLSQPNQTNKPEQLSNSSNKVTISR